VVGALNRRGGREEVDGWMCGLTRWAGEWRAGCAMGERGRACGSTCERTMGMNAQADQARRRLEVDGRAMGRR
jgi:hypothetical protein